MEKVLLVATVQSHICQFHKPLVRVLREFGYEVHVAARNNLAEKDGLALDFVDRVYDLPFARKPLSKKNWEAYRALKALIREQNYAVVHCNTPVGGVLARLACRRERKKGMRVLYTAHGFHFYQGAPKRNWLLYYPIEWVCAKWTDRLLTITQEDEVLAKAKFKSRVFRIHGVGADPERFHPISLLKKEQLRAQYGVPNTKQLILCVGELLPNKNQKTAIWAMAEVVKAYPDALLCIAGNGSEHDALQAQIYACGLEEHVCLLGYTTHIADWYGMCDALVSCSYREGLPMNVIEAMLCAKPVVASDNRGHRELVADGVTGFLLSPDDANGYADALKHLLADPTHAADMGLAAMERAQIYTAERVESELKSIYRSL
ncbi:MAG: glycosyltransferase family 4 protein [Clostridia bacterium]|nr:glycosyltransferase family 4 protein [Clostridia bacterium]